MKAFLFPGQGSQVVGMGGELFDEFETLTQQASEILGYSIKALCLEDNDGNLNNTKFTQPALFTVNALSYIKRTKELNDIPDYVAGHSLGEFNALLAAQCIDFETGLKLVKKRGELMSQAKDGGMAAVLNASKEQIELILQQNNLTGIDLANFNTPSQIVISGKRDEILEAQQYFSTEEMLYYPLNTSGAFHSRYMQAAKIEFESFLKTFTFSDPKIPVIANISAKPYLGGDIIQNLADQITGAVKWNESIQYLINQGDVEFVELGEGELLSKMVANIKGEINLKDKKQLPQDLEKSDDESDAAKKVHLWNATNPIGTRVKSTVVESESLETRSEAMVLFGHRAAVYMKGYNGYFDLDELNLA